MGQNSDQYEGPSFPFTEDRLAELFRMIAAGTIKKAQNGRAKWRDEKGDSLYIRASSKHAIYYFIATRGGKRVDQRIGDASRIRLDKARKISKRLAAGDKTAAPEPIRPATTGPTVEKVWLEYLEASESGTFFTGRKPPAPSTLKSYGENFRPHVLKSYGSKSLGTLSKNVQMVLATLASKPATQKRLLQILTNLFLYAKKQGYWSEALPTIDPDTGKPIKTGSVASRARVIKTDELRKILTAAENELYPWNVFWPLLFLTGVRVGTLRQMRWADLDTASKPPVWTIGKTKNGDPHNVPLSKVAVQLIRQVQSLTKPAHQKKELDRAKKLLPKPELAKHKKRLENLVKSTEYVFSQERDPTQPIHDVNKNFTKLLKLARVKDVRIHDIRRTVATLQLRSGLSLPQVMAAGGWKSLAAVAVYARADLKDAAQGTAATEQAFSDLTGGK